MIKNIFSRILKTAPHIWFAVFLFMSSMASWDYGFEDEAISYFIIAILPATIMIHIRLCTYLK